MAPALSYGKYGRATLCTSTAGYKSVIHTINDSMGIGETYVSNITRLFDTLFTYSPSLGITLKIIHHTSDYMIIVLPKNLRPSPTAGMQLLFTLDSRLP